MQEVWNGGGPLRPVKGRRRGLAIPWRASEIHPDVELTGRRTRCDGQSPCAICQLYSEDCVYERNSDGRRSAARKRVAELEARVRELEGGGGGECEGRGPRSSAAAALSAAPRESTGNHSLSPVDACPPPTAPPASRPMVVVSSEPEPAHAVEGPGAPRARTTSEASSAGRMRAIPQNFNTGNLHVVCTAEFLSAVRPTN